MTIYTRTGDLGETGLLGGPRVAKDVARIEVCGAVDELNTALGLARSELVPEETDEILLRIQNELFDLGAELSAPDPVESGTRTINQEHVGTIEANIDRIENELEPLRQFILPGGTRAAAHLHHARAVCRRAERRLATLMRLSEEPISRDLVAYMNRLSDLLFVLARAANATAGQPDVLWHRGR
jgi:cob(I)alamin adenosyltransferase